MSDRSTETPNYLTMAEAANITPRRLGSATIWRWARRGLRTQGGGTIKLQHVRIGGRLYTTELWLHEFFRKTAEEDMAGCSAAVDAAPACAAHADADRELCREGL